MQRWARRRLHNFLGEGLASFKARAGCARPEAGDSRRVHGVDDAKSERQFGAWHDKVHSVFTGKGDKRRYVAVGDGLILRQGGRSSVSGRDKNFVHAGALLQFPGKGMLAPSRTDDEYAHGDSWRGRAALS